MIFDVWDHQGHDLASRLSKLLGLGCHSRRKFVAQYIPQILDGIINLYDIGNKSHAVAVVRVFSSVNCRERLDRAIAALMPTIDGNGLWFRDKLKALHHIFLVAGDECAWFPGALLQLALNQSIVLFKVLNTAHILATWQSHRFELHLGLGIDIINHQGRWQTEIELLCESIDAAHIQGHANKVLV